MEKFSFIDKQITHLINSLLPHNQFFDYFFSFFSLRGNASFIWIVIIILILIFEERKNPGISKRDISFVVTFLICFLTASIISQIIIKNIVKRARPCAKYIHLYKEYSVDFNCPVDYSFPSSHATTAFAAATVISIFDKKRKWLYLFIAILISLSRIYLGFHYFFDIASGAFIGLLISRIILFIDKSR